MPKRMERFKSRLKRSAVVNAKPKEEAKFNPDGRTGLASIKTAMMFGNKNPPPKKKRRIRSSTERHMEEIEAMDRDVEGKKRKPVRKKGK